ncbi:MAG: hypothetical protein VXW29_03885 [SAR324 cluster bacterium]|nr:hypothetical protein [SAR324 cluster bacterium]
MTKAEVYVNAWRLGFKGDFSLVDEIYHPDYSALDRTTGVEVNLASEKVIILTISELITLGPCRTTYEDLNFLIIDWWAKSILSGELHYNFTFTAVTFKDKRILTQESVTGRSDQDPSEGQNWNWEDYE